MTKGVILMSLRHDSVWANGDKDITYALETPYPDFEVKRRKTALVLIDIQKIASPEPFVKAAIKKGLPACGRLHDQEARHACISTASTINAKKTPRGRRWRTHDIQQVPIEEDPG